MEQARIRIDVMRNLLRRHRIGDREDTVKLPVWKLWGLTDRDLETIPETEAIDRIATYRPPDADLRVKEISRAVGATGYTGWHRRTMEPVTAALLRANGIEPRELLAIMVLEMTAAFSVGEGSQIRTKVECNLPKAIPIAPKIMITDTAWWWDGSVVVQCAPPPDTVLIGAAGLPLRTLVSHELLDPMDLSIDRVETFPVGMKIRIAGGAPVPALTI